MAYWNAVIHGEGEAAGPGALTADEIARAAQWIHSDATKLRMPKGGFPSKHGY